jgi:PhnB protein
MLKTGSFRRTVTDVHKPKEKIFGLLASRFKPFALHLKWYIYFPKSNTMSNTEMELMPYLQFQGNCEEALNFYKDVLNGRIEIVSRYDNPAMNAPDDFKNKILHAAFYFGKYQLFASDSMPKKAGETFNPNISLSLGLHDEEPAKNIFDRLSEGGKIHVPFKKQFWGDWHGNFTDRFGIRWMVNCTK